jgi:DNA-binding GntR family transcriptional regulator
VYSRHRRHAHRRRDLRGRTPIERATVERATVEGEGGIIAATHTLVALTKKAATDRTSMDTWNRAHDHFHEALIATYGSPRVF